MSEIASGSTAANTRLRFSTPGRIASARPLARAVSVSALRAASSALLMMPVIWFTRAETLEVRTRTSAAAPAASPMRAVTRSVSPPMPVARRRTSATICETASGSTDTSTRLRLSSPGRTPSTRPGNSPATVRASSETARALPMRASMSSERPAMAAATWRALPAVAAASSMRPPICSDRWATPAATSCTLVTMSSIRTGSTAVRMPVRFSIPGRSVSRRPGTSAAAVRTLAAVSAASSMRVPIRSDRSATVPATVSMRRAVVSALWIREERRPVSAATAAATSRASPTRPETASGSTAARTALRFRTPGRIASARPLARAVSVSAFRAASSALLMISVIWFVRAATFEARVRTSPETAAALSRRLATASERPPRVSAKREADATAALTASGSMAARTREALSRPGLRPSTIAGRSAEAVSRLPARLAALSMALPIASSRSATVAATRPMSPAASPALAISVPMASDWASRAATKSLPALTARATASPSIPTSTSLRLERPGRSPSTIPGISAEAVRTLAAVAAASSTRVPIASLRPARVEATVPMLPAASEASAMKVWIASVRAATPDTRVAASLTACPTASASMPARIRWTSPAMVSARPVKLSRLEAAVCTPFTIWRTSPGSWAASSVKATRFCAMRLTSSGLTWPISPSTREMTLRMSGPAAARARPAEPTSSMRPEIWGALSLRAEEKVSTLRIVVSMVPRLSDRIWLNSARVVSARVSSACPLSTIDWKRDWRASMVGVASSFAANRPCASREPPVRDT